VGEVRMMLGVGLRGGGGVMLADVHAFPLPPRRAGAG
jgi:hypothetical protein